MGVRGPGPGSGGAGGLEDAIGGRGRLFLIAGGARGRQDVAGGAPGGTRDRARDRRAGSHAGRARPNATRAIRAAIANLARANPSLGRHLEVAVRTGRSCSYTPDPRAPITWEL